MFRFARQLTVGECAQFACILEATARKAGNVHPCAAFANVDYADFVISALAIGPVLQRVRELGVAQAVLECVRRTQAVVQTNTNLGIVLLLAPLAAVPADVSLRAGIAGVLEQLTVEHTRLVYEAIRLARPGGLGRVSEQDVAGVPTVDLCAVMRLAAERDLVARQYANGYREVFEIGVPALADAVNAGRNWEQAVVRCHLTLMSQCPDTLIARKRGEAEAAESARRAAQVLAADWPSGQQASTLFDELDRWLRAVGHERNPGATADLTTASLFAVLRDGTIGS